MTLQKDAIHNRRVVRMSEQIASMLVEHGAMGVFALYLVWQRRLDASRLDATVAKLTERAEVEETKLRDRYDSVVAKLDAERAALQTEIASKLDRLLMIMEMRKPSAPLVQPPSVTQISKAISQALKDDEK